MVLYKQLLIYGAFVIITVVALIAFLNFSRKITKTYRTMPSQQVLLHPIIQVDHHISILSKMDSLADDFSWANMLKLADMYAYGQYPHFSPNEPEALECYRVCTLGSDKRVATTAARKYQDLRAWGSFVDETDRVGEKLPPRAAMRARAVAMSMISYADMIRHNNDIVPLENTTPAATDTENAADPDMYRDDGQNVHDHSVARTVYSNIAGLQEYKTGSIDGVVEQVVDSLLNSEGIDAQLKANALEVVDSLNDDYNTGTGTSQLGALHAVWNRISAIPSEEKRDNVTDTLMRQLASGVEKGRVVCSTGKIARIVGALDGADLAGEHEVARPMWVVRQELGNLAARLRDENEGIDTDSRSDIKAEFEDKVRREYIQKLGYSDRIMNPIIQEYVECFE